MKAFAPLALLALAVGIAAMDPTCEANYILDVCVDTEDARIGECDTSDYDCLCAGHQALRTCYNNCPNDDRIPAVEGQVTIHCQNASLYGTKTKTTRTNTAATAIDAKPTVSDADATPTDDSSSPTPTGGSAQPDDDNGAAELARNTGAVLLAVAGVVAAVL